MYCNTDLVGNKCGVCEPTQFRAPGQEDTRLSFFWGSYASSKVGHIRAKASKHVSY